MHDYLATFLFWRRQKTGTSFDIAVTPLRPRYLLGWLQFTKLCWAGKYIHIIMKPTNSPNQGKPNPRKNRLKVAFGPLFPTADYFFVGWNWLYIGNRLQESQPNRNLRKYPIITIELMQVSNYDDANKIGTPFEIAATPDRPRKKKEKGSPPSTLKGGYSDSSQNPRWTPKTMYSYMFTPHRWFWILCSPVLIHWCILMPIAGVKY